MEQITLRQFLLEKTDVCELCVIREDEWIVACAWIDNEDLFAGSIPSRLGEMPVKGDSWGKITILDTTGKSRMPPAITSTCTVTSVSVYAESAEARYATRAKERFAGKIAELPSVPAVPLDKLCEWMAAEYVTIPCHLCDYFENGRCIVENDMKTTCPSGADEWRKVLEKWMEIGGI